MPTDRRGIYQLIPIPLGKTYTEHKVVIGGELLVAAQIPITVMARLNDKASKQIDLAIFRRIKMQVDVIYITTTTISTTDLLLFTSKDIEVDVLGFGERVTLVNTIGIDYDARDVRQEVLLANNDNIDNGAEEASGEIVTTGYNKITGFVVADEVLTIDIYGYYVSGGTAHLLDEITTVANVPYAFEVPVVAPIMEIRFDNNSGSNTTTCEKTLSLSTGV